MHPPQLHWAWVLVLSFLTNGLFGAVWLVVQAWWARRLRGGRTALFLAVLCTALVGSECVRGWLLHTGVFDGGHLEELTFAVWLAAVYTLRGELVSEPIGLQLGYVGPLFFGAAYLQYYLGSAGSNAASGRPLGL